MLEILPIQTKIEQEAICGRCRIPYDPDCLAYQALKDGVLAGVCQFGMDDRIGRIHHLILVRDSVRDHGDDKEILFSLGRAALNFIDLCGVHKVVWGDGEFPDPDLLSAIGFHRDADGKYRMDLTGFPVPKPPRTGRNP